jgi:hypothetical protein
MAELLVQRREIRLVRRALRRDPPAVRRKIRRQLLRRQTAVGDVSFCAATRRDC